MISLALIPVALMKHPGSTASGWQKIFFLKNKQLRGSFWLFLVIAISIVPVNCFFSYAQDKEIALQTKADQLDMAENIEHRLSMFDWVNWVAKRKFSDSIFLTRNLSRQLCYPLHKPDQ
jgi:hypothetical protein